MKQFTLWSIVAAALCTLTLQVVAHGNHWGVKSFGYRGIVPRKSHHYFHNFHKYIPNIYNFKPRRRFTTKPTPRTIHNVAEQFEKAFCQNGVKGHGKKDGKYAHPKKCEKYIVCQGFENINSVHKKVQVKTCEDGLFFNSKKGICDWPSEVDCFLYQGRACYGAKGNRYGIVKATRTGYLRGMKLIHVDGYLTCAKKKPTYKSFWGCNTKVEGFNKKINTWVTNGLDRDGIVFPDYQTEYDGYGNYHLEGYNNLSPYVKWYKGPEKPFKAFRGGEMRIWFGEDLFDIHQNDNAGKHCVDVYALYSYYKPYDDFFEREENKNH